MIYVEEDANTYLHTGIAWDVTATDNDSVASITYVLSGETTGTGTSLSGVEFALGLTTVTWTATDVSGNRAECIFTVTVVDTISPCIGCDTLGISCESIGNQIIYVSQNESSYIHTGTTWDVTATDNDSVASITYVLSGVTAGAGTSLSGVEFALGMTTVIWTATDVSGNTAECTFTVAVRDTVAPTILCEELIDRDICIGISDTLYTHTGTEWNLRATDNDSIAMIEYILTGATTGSGNTLDNVNFRVGETKVIWFATDESGNTDSCSFMVNVYIPPVVTLSGDTTIGYGGTAYLNVEFTGRPPFTVYYHMENDLSTQEFTIPANTTSPYRWGVQPTGTGSHVYELLGAMSDLSCVGTASGRATVTMVYCDDSREISLICPPDTLITLPYGVCETHVVSVDPVIHYRWDSIPGIDPQLRVRHDGPSNFVFGPGVHVVTWEATDFCDLRTVCQQLIVVNNSPCGVNDTIWNADGTVDSIANVVVTDSEGNSYSTVRIDCNCWTGENLRSTRYSDDASPFSVRAVPIVSPTTYVYYHEDYPDTTANMMKYGLLYDWASASRGGLMDSLGNTQGICPDGWALPTVQHYEGLVVYGCDAMRAPNEWYSDNTATNTISFSALPAGYHDPGRNSCFHMMGDAYFWIAEEGQTAGYSMGAHIRYLCPVIEIAPFTSTHGFSVRCVRVR